LTSVNPERHGRPKLPNPYHLRRPALDIGSICTRDAITIDASATLLEAARVMREQHIGALLVVTDTGDGERVTGIATDRDLVVEAMARGMPAESVRMGALAEAMHRGIAHESAHHGPLGRLHPMNPHAA